MKDIINEKVKKYNKEVIDLRRYFHKHPEVGFKEYNTSKKIANLLESFGLTVITNVAKTGVIGILKGSKPGKTIAIRADMDALNIKEKTNLKFKSENSKVMHACGHDGHIAICLGAAKILSELKEEIKGNIKFIFQPAEEGPGGAKEMIDEGALKNPKVDAIIGLHIWPEIDSGYVGIKKDTIMAAADRFDIKIKGLGGHGAVPHLAKDPIVIGSQIVNSLQTIVSREIDPLDCAVVSTCMFNSGSVFNVIPNDATLSGTVRTLNNETRNLIPKRIESFIKNITKANDCSYEFNYSYYYPPTINDKNFTTFFEGVAKEILDEKVFEIKRPSMGGEDFSFYLQKVPGTFFFLGTKNIDKGINIPLHHPEYNIDEDILPLGIKLFCNTAMKYLNS
ncbi:MAG: amidohydrolase [Firmicutes bacterium]|nr:amidohydrolase [Bacillota bacterium]